MATCSEVSSNQRDQVLLLEEASVYEKTSMQKTMFKVIAVTVSFISVIPFTTPAQEVVSNHILKKCFAVGEVVSWGSLYGWCATNIIDRVWDDRKQDSKRYWIGVGLTALVTQIPAAYVTYYYNKSLFWTLFAPVVYSVFSANSLDNVNTKVLTEDNFLTRAIARYKGSSLDELWTHGFLGQMPFDCVPALFFRDAEGIKEIAGRTKGDPNLLTQSDITQLAIVRKNVISQRVDLYRKMNIGFSYVGAIFSTSKSYLEYVLNKHAFKLIWGEDTLVGRIFAFLAVCPNVYLGWDIAKSCYSKLFNQVVECWTTKLYTNPIAREFPTAAKVGRFVSTLFGAFGTGSLITTLRDNIGFDSFSSSLICTIIVSTIVLLTLNSMYAFSDMVMSYLLKGRLSVKNKEILACKKHLEMLSCNLKQLRGGQFSLFLSTKDINPGNFKKSHNALQICSRKSQ